MARLNGSPQKPELRLLQQECFEDCLTLAPMEAPTWKPPCYSEAESLSLDFSKHLALILSERVFDLGSGIPGNCNRAQRDF